jgi:branched-chain amino acid transport system substrate-binding protein
LNDQGGVLGQQIVATSVDDACDPEQAKAAAEKLTAEGVIFVVSTPSFVFW